MERYLNELRDQVAKRPYRALAIAAGVGAVIGADLWTHALRSLLQVGGRLIVTTVIAGFVEQTALSSAGGPGTHQP
jgi:hypothetical protein